MRALQLKTRSISWAAPIDQFDVVWLPARSHGAPLGKVAIIRLAGRVSRTNMLRYSPLRQPNAEARFRRAGHGAGVPDVKPAFDRQIGGFIPACPGGRSGSQVIKCASRAQSSRPKYGNSAIHRPIGLIRNLL